MIIVAVPSHSVREVARSAAPHLRGAPWVVHATKGFEPDTLKRISEVLAEEFPAYLSDRIAVLSGPSHAEEVARRSPTAVVVSSQSRETAEAVQSHLINSYFRVYTNPDLIGVEIGGALKNIIALGAGLSDGLGFGDNAKAALMTRGLAEIARLGMAMGARPITFAGLAGVGDLVVTCTSRHSRNWRAGYMLSQGKALEDVLAGNGNGGGRRQNDPGRPPAGANLRGGDADCGGAVRRALRGKGPVPGGGGSHGTGKNPRNGGNRGRVVESFGRMIGYQAGDDFHILKYNHYPMLGLRSSGWGSVTARIG